ncbi:hypothetical protein C2U70_27565 [Bradyrhizobium guangdongense]|uniref:hypothetical protein n=1 Tax=Bradyrhizobium guangdongense TaxID=1325090 RepID=UPI00112D5644|nr:hypothetical protein [Bradyrhizobium guangdongense]TPQ30037.1 hypothetical protein C2U70_27565 [Bradyrhizobium guangdongense]
MRLSVLIPFAGAVFALSAQLPIAHAATGGEPVATEQVDVAPCLAAASADNDDKVDAHCPAVIDSEKTPKPERLKALIARGDYYVRRGMVDRAIADYSQALLLEPSADIYNARGELWLRTYDRPKAVQDFGAALKLNPNHEKAKANHKALAQELERIGARMAIAGRPSFNCARARRAVEKAICASPDLADLDSDIQGSYVRAFREARKPSDKKLIQREQDAYLARRNAEFGRPGYDLKKAMLDRLREINGVDGY